MLTLFMEVVVGAKREEQGKFVLIRHQERSSEGRKDEPKSPQ